MEAFLEKFQKRYGGIYEITGQEKKQRDVERVNELIEERRDHAEIIMPKDHQQNANASGNVKKPDPLGHADSSSTRFYDRNRFIEAILEGIVE
jgi:hypothetical protein